MCAALLLFRFAAAQSPCVLSLSGYVIDEHDGQPLAFAEVVFSDGQRGTVVDSSGFYQFENLCAGEYEITAYHIGCEPVTKTINLQKNTEGFNFYPEHHRELLREAAVAPKPAVAIIFYPKYYPFVESSNGKIKDLKIPALDILQSGGNVQKPMIRGFYGNRINTVSSGVSLQDQQWGQDHAPSFSLYPFQTVSLVNGADALEQGPAAVGGVFRLSSRSPFFENNHLFFSGFTNGRGGDLAFVHQNKITEDLAYGIQGTARRHGDLQAPDYFLTNTATFIGNGQFDISFFKNGWHWESTISYDHKNLGILRSSHIGNLTDFEEALKRNKPFFTEEFSYQIENPRQMARHLLGKTSFRKFFSRKLALELNYSYQNNLREEFDIRRGNRSDIPSIDLQLQTHQFQLKSESRFEKWIWESGTEQEFQINTNLPNTGVAPVLPNCNQSRTGVFSTALFHKFSNPKINYIDFGIRYDFYQNIAQFFDETNDLRKENFDFHIISSVGSFSYLFSEDFSSHSELSFITRAPAPNELLARGLHHGTATIEEGNLDLRPERSFRFYQRFRWEYSKKWNLDVSVYANPIQDFIYQQPLPEPRLTVRGAFPVLQQEQTDAFFAGLELQGQVFWKKFIYGFQGNYIYAKDVKNDGFLPLVPPLNVRHDLRFQTNFSKKWKAAFVKIGQSFTAEQTRFDPAQDLAPPPESYFLHEAAIGITHDFGKSETQFSLRAENLFDKKYRNYLDRFRYFSDAQGFNLIFECLINI